MAELMQQQEETHPSTDLEFEKKVANAETNGVITKQESDELWLQYLVTCGTRRKTQESVYAGIEVAIAAGSDVDRACQRSVETLLRVPG